MELDQDQVHTDVEQLPHPPNALVWKIQERIQQLYREGKFSGEQLLSIDHHISGFLEVCGGCERIKNTPIPYSYSSFTKKFIVLYVITLPVAYGMSIGYMMIFLTVLVFYVLMSLEVLAEEIEEPFNNEENDLPMELIAQNIERNVIRIFNEN